MYIFHHAFSITRFCLPAWWASDIAHSTTSQAHTSIFQCQQNYVIVQSGNSRFTGTTIPFQTKNVHSSLGPQNITPPMATHYLRVRITIRKNKFLLTSTLTSSLPSYLRDTDDFLKKLSQLPLPSPENLILTTIDGTALFTNIPQIHGLAAVENFLYSRNK